MLERNEINLVFISGIDIRGKKGRGHCHLCPQEEGKIQINGNVERGGVCPLFTFLVLCKREKFKYHTEIIRIIEKVSYLKIIVMHQLKTGIHSEKYVRWFCHCTNSIECSYTNPNGIAPRLHGIYCYICCLSLMERSLSSTWLY